MTLVWLGLLVGWGCGVAGAWHLVDASGRRAGLVRRIDAAASQGTTSVLFEGLMTRLSRTRVARLVGTKLAAAGLEMRPAVFLGSCTGGLVAMLVLAVNLGSPTLAVVIVGLALLGLRAWLNYRIQQRRERFIAQLPDLARLLSNAANAGLALKTGIEMAAREIGEPARTELRQVTEALAVGFSIDEALADMSRRLPSREVAVLITTLVVQQRSGGRIITALQNVATTLETRKEVRREIRTLMAGVLSSTYLVIGIGVGSVLVLNLVNPGVLDQMVASGVGRLVLVFSAALYILGFGLVRRMTDIEP